MMSNFPSLSETHRHAGAEFAPAGSGSRPLRYGDAALEYRAARRHAVVIDQSHRGRLRVSGRDRLDLLQRLTTNDMHGLTPGLGLSNLFLTAKGRIIELFDVLAFDDHLLLLLASSRGTELAEWIRRFTFIEDVVVTEVTGDTAELGVFGPAAATVLGAAGAQARDITGRDHQRAEIGGAPVTVAGAAPLAGLGFRVVCAQADGAQVWQALVESGATHGLRPAGAETEEILRIEAGLPAPGHELSERFNPLEAELRHAISFTKGCYTGQEVVARLNTYEKVQRGLRGLRVAGEVAPAPDSRVLAGGAGAGVVTSAVRSPGLGAILALAYVELEHSAPGSELAVEISPGQTAAATVLEPPPFVTSGGEARAGAEEGPTGGS